MNIGVLNKAMDELKDSLGEGLIASDIWEKGIGSPIVSFKGSAKAATLFDKIIADIEKASEVSGFPKMQEYFIMKLKGNIHVVVILHKNIEWKILVDGNKVQLGLVLSVSLPKAVAAIKSI